MSAIYIVSDREWEAVDEKVAELLHEPYILSALPKLSIQGAKKAIEYYRALELKIYKEGHKFDYEAKNTMARSVDKKPITRVTIPIHIDAQDNNLSQTEGIESLLVTMELEAEKWMQDRQSHIVFHGSGKVGGSEGMTNFNGLATSAAAGNWTTPGNFFIDLETAISSLRSNKVLPPYTLIMTPGIPAELRGNNISAAGGYQNEWKTFLDIYCNFIDQREIPTLIDEIYVTDAILDATLATGNQCFLLFKNEPNSIYVAESDPVSRMITPNTKFESDIDYVKIWGGCFIPKNPDAVYLVSAGTTGSAY